MNVPTEPMNSGAACPRRSTRSVVVGGVQVGGGAPVVVQSMTNTDTADHISTAIQVAQLARAGSELVRITVNNDEAAKAVPRIAEQLAKMNVSVPLIGDFHYNGHKLLGENPACAAVLAKLRINPGNVGQGAKRDTQFAQIIEIACRFDKPVRIGVNWGSLDQSILARIMDDNAKRAEPRDAGFVMREAMVTSALESAARAEEYGLGRDRIILSCKVSSVQDLIAIYRDLATRSDYPLHLGLTEAGMGSKGIVASTAALAVLLQEGIGDTIRVSLTPEPGASRTQPWEAASVMREALVTSAIESAQRAEQLGLGADQIILSAKVSSVQDLIAVYRELARRCDYPLHLGLTEAGMGSKGIVASTAAMAVLLQEGIGDTIRVSLTPEPNGDRSREVVVAQEILQTMGLRAFAPMVVACPGCGRTSSTFFQELADRIQRYLREQMPIWRGHYPGVETLQVAVMGCVVNGPGESKHADIGISLPGADEAPVAPVFIDGARDVTLKGDRIAEEFQAIVENYVRRRYGAALKDPG